MKKLMLSLACTLVAPAFATCPASALSEEQTEQVCTNKSCACESCECGDACKCESMKCCSNDCCGCDQDDKNKDCK